MQNSDGMKFNIKRTSTPENNSIRVQSVRADYDYQSKNIVENFKGEIDLPDNWNIGVIVGSSGSGKSTIADELFKESFVKLPEKRSPSVIDDMPKNIPVNEICSMFNHLGFSSVPSWLKPYSVLSNGEKMRTDLAYSLLSKQYSVKIFDEFTSVVDRQVAENLCIALEKTVRSKKEKFIAVSCHEDICEWLQPDWVFNTDTMEMVDPKHSDANTEDSKSEDARVENGKTLAVITI